MQLDNLSQNNISYQGITRILKQQPFIYNETSAPFMQPEKVIGTIPKDFLQLINKKDVKQIFSGIDKTLCDSFGTFSFLESYINTRLKSYIEKLSFIGFVKFTIEQIKYLCQGKSIYDKNFLFNSIGLDENFIKTTEKTLSDNLKTGFVKSELINDDDKLNVRLLDFGGFGTVYKMSCQDKNGKKVFNDKALKFYRDRKEKDSIYSAIELLNYRMIKNHQKISSLTVKLLYLAFVKTGVLSKKIFDSLVDRKLNQINICSTEAEYAKFINEQADLKTENVFKKYHGVYREANIALYIQKNIGHSLKRSDAINFWFSNPKYCYSVFEFSDENTLGKVNKYNRLSDLGIRTDDAIFNNRPKNYVDGRLIDYGDFKPINSTLCNSKVARRYYKKIMNAGGKGEEKLKRQRELLARYYALANENKIPNRNEVLTGLAEAEKILSSN